MQAIILAAGMGKRLKQLTQNNTKCMVKVNGVPLINRTLSQLEQHDLSRIVIVTGVKPVSYFRTGPYIRCSDGDSSGPGDFICKGLYSHSCNGHS